MPTPPADTIACSNCTSAVVRGKKCPTCGTQN